MTMRADVRRWTDISAPITTKVVNMTDTAVSVLLIDAEQSEYMLIAHLAAAIRPHHHQVSWCNRFDRALDAMLSGEYDIILLDCQRDFEAARELMIAAVDGGCSAPIVVLSDVFNT